MYRARIVAIVLTLSGCATTPEEKAAEAATDRFEACMDRTLASVGPFTYGSQEARLKAAEICRDVMKQQ
ncbi:hypothetical protein ACFPN2_00600 [Steroidobacter flavus]|uniref:Lipoprotein n=1 Tax=Steroidobacter flavus TaxID=1842136 RepID=A0ABV8SLS6_9GAMM